MHNLAKLLLRRWHLHCLGILIILTPPLYAGEPVATRLTKVERAVTAPLEPTQKSGRWAYYVGILDIDSLPRLDPHGIDFKWAYSRKDPLPENPRIVVNMHGAGGGNGAIMSAFEPSTAGDIEVRTQDADTYNLKWREWWTFGANGEPYPGRRITAILNFVSKRYGIDVSNRGIVLVGNSMGGAGAVIQTMILPDPWRQSIAYSAGRIGPMLPREVAKRDPGQYGSMAPDNGKYKDVWDGIDFSIQAKIDPVVRGMHYRHQFGTDDIFSRGVSGNTQLEFVNLVEKYKISGAFSWAKSGHGTHEPGVRLPKLISFESEEQDVTLDRAHPAITNSTGNFPLLPQDRINESKFPRGHYNIGITWDHANIVDTPTQLAFPLKYKRWANIGKNIPDQPKEITISVTPRRLRNFDIADGESLKWSFDGGVLTGVAVVNRDTVTIDNIPLKSDAPYKTLRIFR
jgi:hypothetical protein